MNTKGIYEGKPVEIVRPAKQGDQDFNANAGEQLVIKLADGSEKTVAKSAVAPT